MERQPGFLKQRCLGGDLMGYLVHVGATVICPHAGQAQPMVPNLRVKVSNQQIVTQSTSYTVAGCALPSPPTANGSMRYGTVDDRRYAGKGRRFAGDSPG